MTQAPHITVAYGDGIGPEIMEATLKILAEAKANLAIDTIEIGERVYKMGESSGIPPSAWDTLRRNKILLKAPITTPQGGGYKSLNVTLRKTLGLYANVRPCVSLPPLRKNRPPLPRPGRGARKRRGHLRRHRTPPNPGHLPKFKTHQLRRFRTHLPLCI